MTWAPDYATTAELAAFLRITDSADDDQLALAVSAASRAVDDHCRRQFGQVAEAEARFYRPWFDCGWWVVPIDDLMDDDGLLVEVDTAGDLTYSETVATVSFRPANAAPKGRPWTSLLVPASSSVRPTTNGYEQVQVTALWGWETVPATVQQATLLQASRFFARRNAPFGVAGSPDSGSEMRLLAKVDPDVATMLTAYRRPAMVA